jgi:hypothetical protein
MQVADVRQGLLGEAGEVATLAQVLGELLT